MLIKSNENSQPTVEPLNGISGWKDQEAALVTIISHGQFLVEVIEPKTLPTTFSFLSTIYHHLTSTPLGISLT